MSRDADVTATDLDGKASAGGNAGKWSAGREGRRGGRGASGIWREPRASLERAALGRTGARELLAGGRRLAPAIARRHHHCAARRSVCAAGPGLRERYASARAPIAASRKARAASARHDGAGGL